MAVTAALAGVLEAVGAFVEAGAATSDAQALANSDSVSTNAGHRGSLTLR